jgi:AraC-like DNA-binding protein
MGQSFSAKALAGLRDLPRLDVAITTLGFVLHRPPCRQTAFANLVHRDFVTLSYTLAGKAWYRAQGQEILLRRGDLVWVQPGEPHWARSDGQAPWSYLVAGFGLEARGSNGELVSSLPLRVEVGDPEEAQGLFMESYRTWRQGQAGFIPRTRGLLLQLCGLFIGEVSREQAPGRAWQRLEPALTRIHNNVGRVHSVEELAESVELSESRFRELFRRTMGQSVTRYQNQLRISQARELLLAGEMNVSQVAAATGFRDVYYFSRLFKKFTGKRPSDLR